MAKIYSPTWKSLSGEFGGDERAMRRAYTKMRDVAQKRIKRLGESEFRGAFYRGFFGGSGEGPGFAKLSEFTDKKHKITEKGAFATEMSRLSRFLASPMSSVKGMREARRKSIESLHKAGFEFVNESNYEKFTSFMDRYRALKLDSIYDSDEILEENFAVGEQKGVDPNQLLDEFASWMAVESGLDQYAENNKAPGGTSSAELKKLLGLL